MFTLITTSLSIGCTPCECGVPGACLREELPFFLQFIPSPIIHLLSTFLTPFVLVLIISLLVRWVLKKKLNNVSAAVKNSIAVFIGSLFVLQFIFDSFGPNRGTEITPIVASIVSVILVYALFTKLDLKKEKTTISKSFLGILIIIFLISSISFIVEYIEFSEYNKRIESRKGEIADVFDPLGLLEKSDKVVGILKTENYIAIGEYIDPNKKIQINFRDYTGIGLNKENFLMVVQKNKLSELTVYNNGRVSISIDELFNVVSELLNSNYEIKYYIDNHNYVEENKELSEYSKAEFLYNLDFKKAVLTFLKDPTSSIWYLSNINYFDSDYPGY